MWWIIFQFVWRIGLALKIVILAYNRHEETLKCLQSLNSAFYPADDMIPIEIRIDRQSDDSVDTRVVQVASSFTWKYGIKDVFIHSKHVGLQRQWLSVAATDYTLIIEDDIIISPFYYYVLKSVLYRSDHVLGIALQRPQWQMGINEHGRWRRLDLLCAPPLFAAQIPATWGLVVFPGPWNNLRNWARSTPEWTDGAITNKWREEREDLISPLIFEFLMERDLSIMYFWPGNGTVLARDGGKTTKHYNDALLMDEMFLGKLYKTRNVPRYSACFDRIRLDDGHPNIRGGGDPKRLKSVIAHLRNVCRVAKVNIVQEEENEEEERGNVALDPASYNFDCAFNPSSGRVSLADNLGHKRSIRCGYTKGLYPDNVNP